MRHRTKLVSRAEVDGHGVEYPSTRENGDRVELSVGLQDSRFVLGMHGYRSQGHENPIRSEDPRAPTHGIGFAIQLRFSLVAPVPTLF